MTRPRLMFVALVIVVVALMSSPSAAVSTSGLDHTTRSQASTLTVPGDDFYPESIAATPDGTLFVSSVVTGEILRFPAGSNAAERFVRAGVNTGTAGVIADVRRGVLWACAVDLAFRTPTALRAFDLTDGTLRASYELPDRGICADIALAHGDVYVTDTTDLTAAIPPPGRILRLTTPQANQPTGGTLAVCSADPLLTRPRSEWTRGIGFQVNGIAFDGASTLLTTNLSAGDLLRIPILRDGSAGPATVIQLDEDLVLPDGIRMLDPGRLLVTGMLGRITLIDVNTGETAVVGVLDQPSSLIRVDDSLWVAEGQVLRLFAGEPPNLPFQLKRIRTATLPRETTGRRRN
jgi:hypothetical protein